MRDEEHDLILLRGLAVETVIGVYDWERTAPRPLLVDLELSVDLAAAGASDRVGDTVDYAAVTACLEAVCTHCQPLLLEALAAAMARTLFEQFEPLRWVRLTLHKPGILGQVKDVAIRIVRRRPD